MSIKINWQTDGLSVIGASHSKKEIPNQDSVNYGGVFPAFASVSDGHGGKKYIRSHIGSYFATTAIGEIIEETALLKINMPEMEEAIRHIKSRFLIKWQDKVDDDLAEIPFTQEELDFLKENCTEAEYNDVIERPRTAYGATFLAAIAYDDLVLLLQHGDGDIIGLYGEDAMDLVEPDTRNFAGQTLSLASLFDASEMYHKVIAGVDKLPCIITLFTDGIKNSYNDTNLEEIEKFYKIPLAIKTSLKKREDLTAGLNALLTQMTTYGSGDDVTAALLYNMESIS